VYICICNAIKESDLRAEARLASGSAEELYRRLGREPQCRQCLDEAERVVLEVRDAARLPVPLLH
jgi:bacterioferritin-associated ferredoxin